jgi:phage tail tape-measure protein
MTEEPVRQSVSGDPSLDNDTQDDASKGAAIGGIGGAVAGAVAGSMAGPVGTLAGAVIGGIVGAATSKAAVGAIDKIEHENVALAQGAAAAPPTDAVTSQETGGDPATDPKVIPIPLPDGASTSYKTVDETPDTTSEPEKTY